MHKPHLIVVMGVSGTGKTTIGKLLSKRLNIPFFDGDDYHPAENVAKMTAGKPLDDTDRVGWLTALNKLLQSQNEEGAIVACSALKEKYRNMLREGLGNSCHFVYLKGTFNEVLARLENRKGHFMPTALLESQFATLEPPTDAIDAPISHTPEKIVEHILNQL